jgi:hypothetical protein
MRLTKVVLLGMVLILGNPDWENACVGEVLEMHSFDSAGYDDRIKLLTKKYALRGQPDENQNMKQVYEKLSQEVQDTLMGKATYIVSDHPFE